MSDHEKKVVVKAIDRLGRKVTAADVVTQTGLSLFVVTTALNQVASETGGHLQVSTAGDIAYSFRPGFQSSYLARGLQKYWESFWTQAFKALFLLIRISFGIMLIISLLIIIVLAFILINVLNKDSDGDSEGGFDLSFFDFFILRDLIFGGVYGGYPSYPGYSQYEARHPEERKRIAKQGNRNFFYNCFSFLFGDGSPNIHLEDSRWQLIAQLIKENKGVLTVEMLAPYTDANPDNEDGVLPVLVRFNGRPVVSDVGNILYVFPEMQVSAAQRSLDILPVALNENKWQFCNASIDELVPVMILAVVNCFGSWWLFAQAMMIPPILGQFMALLTLMTVYGTLFIAIPTMRWLTIKYLNWQIEKRNSQRRIWAHALINPVPQLAQKLAEAKKLSLAEIQLKSKDAIYSTEDDLLEQEWKLQKGNGAPS